MAKPGNQPAIKKPQPYPQPPGLSGNQIPKGGPIAPGHPSWPSNANVKAGGTPNTGAKPRLAK